MVVSALMILNALNAPRMPSSTKIVDVFARNFGRVLIVRPTSDFAILDVLHVTDQMRTSVRNVFATLPWMSSGTAPASSIGRDWAVRIGMVYVIVNVRRAMVQMHVIARNALIMLIGILRDAVYVRSFVLVTNVRLSPALVILNACNPMAAQDSMPDTATCVTNIPTGPLTASANVTRIELVVTVVPT